MTLSKNRYQIKPPDFNRATTKGINSLQERFRPFLENRIRSQKNPHLRTHSDKAFQIPYDLEIMMLARSWSSLSDDFKKLYKSSLLFPDTMDVYISQGGHFEIYYTTRGIDSVSVADQYHYSPAPPFHRINQSNAVPDYIDETAWALDSAWRMEIDRFGFQPPYPYKDNMRPSERYKVFIQSPGNDQNDVYGYTMFHQKIDSNSFSSFITIRNEWSAFNTEPLKYDSDPAPAIRVTCAHEFFHAIQYGMTWDLGKFGELTDSSALDDFPLTWTEGSAVTMEELAFPDVNDYVQYTMPYFSNPAISFFSQKNNYNHVYLQSVFLIYISTRLWNNSTSGLIRQMYTNNYETFTPFRENIDKSISEISLTWPQALNRFHTASWFTGSRSDTMLFIADAKLFSEWNPPTLSFQTRSIAENSVGIFSIKKQDVRYDTLFISFQPAQSNPEPDSWAASLIVQQKDSSIIIPVTLNNQGRGHLNISNLNNFEECIAVISNGFSESAREYNVNFSPCPITHANESRDTVFSSFNKKLQPYAIVHATSDLRCDLTITTASMTNRMASVALLNNIQLVDSLFSINYPLTWKDSSNIILCIDSIPKELTLYKWQQDSQSWIQLANTGEDDENIRTVISDIGVFGLFTAIRSTNEKTIIAYPNPAHIRGGNGVITIEGYDIKAAAIYSVSGSLVHQVSKNDLQNNSYPGIPQKFAWNLHTKKGGSLSPGVYTLITQYSNKKSKVTKTKLLLIP